LPDEYFKTAAFCAMCGLKFFPMNNFRDVDWDDVLRLACESEAAGSGVSSPA